MLGFLIPPYEHINAMIMIHNIHCLTVCAILQEDKYTVDVACTIA